MRTIAATTSLLCLAASGAAGAAPDCSSLSSLRWLLGEWTSEGSRSTFRESWISVGPKTWEGFGAETAAGTGAAPDREELRLVEMGNGVYYIAKVPHNELPVAFRLSECAGGRFAFVNSGHDFPRRLEYRPGSDGRLSVRVSDGADKGFALDFTRTPDIAADGDAVFAAEDARFAAMVRADPESMRRWFASGLTYVHSTGEVEDRDQLIDSITSGRKRFIAIEPRDRKVAAAGPAAAIVSGLARFRVVAGPDPLEFDARYLAVYGRHESDWQLLAWQSLRLR